MNQSTLNKWLGVSIVVLVCGIINGWLGLTALVIGIYYLLKN